MDAEQRVGRKSGTERFDQGQSIIEFLMMLPVLIGLVVLLVRSNTAIQISIVNQQYARAQALWLTFNSSVYPGKQLRQVQLGDKKFNQMVIGVSENAAPAQGNFTPRAATQNVTRKKSGTRDEPQTEPKLRDKVRIRDTVTLCTQMVVVNGKEGLTDLLKLGGNEKFDLPVAPFSLSEQTQFKFCSSPMEYVISNEEGGAT